MASAGPAAGSSITTRNGDEANASRAETISGSSGDASIWPGDTIMPGCLLAEATTDFAGVGAVAIERACLPSSPRQAPPQGLALQWSASPPGHERVCPEAREADQLRHLR